MSMVEALEALEVEADVGENMVREVVVACPLMGPVQVGGYQHVAVEVEVMTFVAEVEVMTWGVGVKKGLE